MPLSWEYGIRYDSVPNDVVLGRETNPDGSVTRVMWQAGGLNMCQQIMRSPAPLSALRKEIVRRQVGPIRAYKGDE